MLLFLKRIVISIGRGSRDTPVLLKSFEKGVWEWWWRFLRGILWGGGEMGKGGVELMYFFFW